MLQFPHPPILGSTAQRQPLALVSPLGESAHGSKTAQLGTPKPAVTLRCTRQSIEQQVQMASILLANLTL